MNLNSPTSIITQDLTIGYKPWRVNGLPWRSVHRFSEGKQGSDREHGVVNGLNLSFQAGHCYAVMGENGAGKSCLLKTLAGLLPAKGGAIQIDGRNAKRISARERASWQGYLDQQARPFWDLNVADVVRLGTMVRRDWSTSDAEQATADALHSCGCEAMASRPVLQLSTGEQQRVLLARVLAAKPRIILVDEPTAGLDPRHQRQIMQLLRRQAEQGALVVAVMHDIHLAQQYCDKAVLLAKQRLYGAGNSEALLTEEVLQHVFGIC